MFCRKNFQKIEIAMLFLVSISKSEELKQELILKTSPGLCLPRVSSNLISLSFNSDSSLGFSLDCCEQNILISNL